MTDNITLPRAVGEHLFSQLLDRIHGPYEVINEDETALDALAAALAEPEKETFAQRLTRRSWEAHRAALAEPVHPGYIIGSHWLETAYSRIAAGEAEAEVLVEVLGARGWAKREPATREQVAEAYKASESDGGEVIYCEAWRDAERFHGIRKEDKP
jgi:hypothetical protein